MSRARNERMTLELQIQPLDTKDIPAFFPTIALSDISPFRSFVTFRHYERSAMGRLAASSVNVSPAARPGIRSGVAYVRYAGRKRLM